MEFFKVGKKNAALKSPSRLGDQNASPIKSLQ